MEFHPHKLWIEQCEAAQGIRERFGLEKALGYLIGEKLIEFVRESQSDPLFKEQLPLFLAEVKNVFAPHEIQSFLDGIENTGAESHVLTAEELAFMRSRGVFREDPVRSAEDILIVEQLKAWLA